MSNLTREAGVVRELDPLQSLIPPTGTRLAVFRRTRQGERFLGVLAPEEAYRPSLFEKRSSLRILAVSTDPNLRHDFVRSYLHREQKHNFDLHFHMEYRVEDPSTLVEALSRDPLSRIEEEVASLLGGSVQNTEWAEIKRAPHTIGRRALLTEVASADGLLQTPLVRLRGLSADYGVELRDVQVTCRLGERGVDVDIFIEDQEIKRRKLQEELATEEVRRQGELSIQKMEKEFELEIAAVDRSRHRADQMLVHLNRALERVADSVDSAPALRQAIVELAKLQSELQELTSTAAAVPALPGSEIRALPAAVSYLNGESELMTSVMAHISELDCPAEMQRRLLGKTLQVLGEVMQGEHADGDRLRTGVEDLEELLEGSIRSLRSQDERKFFQDLCDFQWWQHRP